jgi:hypothetical protein
MTRAVRKWNKKTQGFRRSGEPWNEYEIKLVVSNKKLTSFELAQILRRSAHAITSKRYALKKRGVFISKLK